MFYVIRIQNKWDGSEVRSIAPFTDKDSAEIRFHSFLAADMGNENMSSVLVVLMNEDGQVLMNRHWVAPTPEPVVEGGEN